MLFLNRRRAVFVGVAAAGAALGTVIVGGVIAGYTAVRYQSWLLENHDGYYTAALLVGAALGAVLGVAAGFGPLRRAPIGRLFGWTTLGTTLGVASGFATGGSAPIVLGIVGFFAGALHVERREWLAGRLPAAPGAVDAPSRVLSD